MPIPIPSTPLVGDCSAINNDTLYVYSDFKFQALSLKENATWSALSTGQPVTGPACVTAVPNGDESNAALYLIGGASNDTNYGGIQRYVFANSSWETLTSSSPPVLQGRQNHTAAYLNDTQSILVYAGSQPDAPSYLSSQTFVLSTLPPYDVESYTSEAPPGNQPIVEPWNSTHAVMVGGSDVNTQIWTFQPSGSAASGGWQQFDTSLPTTLDSNARAQVIDTTDGGKVLALYNMSVSPNTITNYVLLNSSGVPAATGTTVGGSAAQSRRKRDLSISRWPTYNSSDAPTQTWTDCGLARNPDGLVVISGGSSDAHAPVALFDQADNSWLNASRFFGDSVQQPLQPSSTPTASSTPSSAPAASSGSHDNVGRTVGIVLGVVLGLAAVIIAALLFMRHRRIQAQRAKKAMEEKDDTNRLSFADRGASFMKEAGVSMEDALEPPQSLGHPGHTSNSSMAIMAGVFRPTNNRLSSSHTHKSSFESTAHLVRDKRQSAVVGEQVEMMDLSGSSDGGSNVGNGLLVEPAPAPNRMTLAVPGTEDGSDAKKTRRNRSSGWSKYFATSAPTGPNGLSHLPSAYGKRETVRASSVYSDSRPGSTLDRVPSIVLPPSIDVDLGSSSGPFAASNAPDRFSEIGAAAAALHDSRDLGSEVPSTSNTTRTGHTAQQASIAMSHRSSQAASISSYGARSTISSQMSSDYYNPMGGHTPWTPMNGSGAAAAAAAHISTGSESFFGDGTSSIASSRPDSGGAYAPTGLLHDMSTKRPSRGKSVDFFPGAGTSYRPLPRVRVSRPSLSESVDEGVEDQESKTTPAVVANTNTAPSPVVEEDEDALAALPPLEPPNRAKLFQQQNTDQNTSGRGDDGSRDSTITLFPSGGQEHEEEKVEAEKRGFNTDMSWVNLGS